VSAGAADVGIAKWPSRLLDVLPLEPFAPFGLLVPHDHPLAGRANVSVYDFDGEPLLIVARSQAAEQHDVIVRFYTEAGIRPDFRERVISSIDQVVDFVATGQGIGEVPMTTSPAPQTVLVPVVEPRPPLDALHMMWDRVAQPPLVHQLIEIAKHHFARTNEHRAATMQSPTKTADHRAGRRPFPPERPRPAHTPTSQS
jgi:DNA-binding transcriptional LysR family regulator